MKLNFNGKLIYRQLDKNIFIEMNSRIGLYGNKNLFSQHI